MKLSTWPGTRTRGATLLGAVLLSSLLTTGRSAESEPFHYVDRAGKVHNINPRPKAPSARRIAPVSDTAAASVRDDAHLKLDADSLASPPIGASALYVNLIRDAALVHKVPTALVLAVVEVESSFDPQAVSESGAVGLMQLLPSTAFELGVTNPFDARQNVYGGTRYLRRLLERFGPELRTVLAAYNAGPGAVERAQGAPLQEKTERYVAKALAAYARWLRVYPEAQPTQPDSARTLTSQ
ncbi:MAG TPA: lytic transglycosylase domain-containing protein [Polyangiaceae bacterium]|nr:lytic transglycosylase domain-containing protein [Polyangiaceae bacterium]